MYPIVLCHGAASGDATPKSCSGTRALHGRGPLTPDMAAGSALPELLAYVQVPILAVRDFGVPRLPSLHTGRASYTREAEC